MSFYLSPTIACLVCHRLHTSPVYIPMVYPLASHLPGLPWEETVSFYLSPTIACHLPGLSWEETVSFYLSPTIACHLPGLPWEEIVSFYLSPTIACLVCHRLNTSPVYIPVVSPLASHLPGLPWEETVSFYLSPTMACHGRRLCPSTSPLP